MNILLVEDDAGTRLAVTRGLEQSGHRITVATCGQQALDALTSIEPSLVILDVGLPDIDGFEVCHRIRRRSWVPIVMLTARNDEEAVLRGYSLKIDDYVTKPCSPRLLRARVAAILRRDAEGRRRQRKRSVRLGRLTVDVECCQAELAGVPVELTPRESRLLFLLASNAGYVVRYGRLVDFGWQYNGGSRTQLRVSIHHLRKKLEEIAPGAVVIDTVTDTGYRLTFADDWPE